MKVLITASLGSNFIGSYKKTDGIVERASVILDVNKGFYLLHKSIFREESEPNKLRAVYDAFAKSSRESPSLNECLEKPPC